MKRGEVSGCSACCEWGEGGKKRILHLLLSIRWVFFSLSVGWCMSCDDEGRLVLSHLLVLNGGKCIEKCSFSSSHTNRHLHPPHHHSFVSLVSPHLLSDPLSQLDLIIIGSKIDNSQQQLLRDHQSYCSWLQ